MNNTASPRTVASHKFSKVIETLKARGTMTGYTLLSDTALITFSDGSYGVLRLI